MSDAPNPPTAAREFTLSAVLLGSALSLTFGMVNAYLGLRVGLTVSASIPSAVLSMALLRGLLRRGTLLENNLVHTIASSGESLAAGVIFTIPALLLLGLAPTAFEIFLIGGTAGVLGVLMMVPLRRPVIAERGDELPFPEGTACAKVLEAGERGGSSARPVFGGILAGGLFTFVGKGLALWKGTVFWSFEGLRKASFGFDLSPLFLGVGYLVGPRVAAVMAGGGLLGWVVLIPFFDLVGASFPGVPDGIATMDAWAIWSGVVRYVGAGAVTAGGLISMVRALPAMKRSFANFRTSFGSTASTDRRDRDLPGSVVLGGIALCAAAMWALPVFDFGLTETALAVVFTFFFVVVSAEIVGWIGTTSQPVSGMTITALLATALVILVTQGASEDGAATALRVAAVVCIGIALAGDTAQDLRCGAILGATPSVQQIGEIIGVLISALRAGWVLYLLHAAYEIGSATLPAPQAKLMATLATGVMAGDLPWALMGLGAAIAVVVECFGLPSLPFAIGLYLPVTTSAPLLLGGGLRWWLEREPDSERDDRMTLAASGLVAGDALVGIGIAVLVVSGLDTSLALRSPGEGFFEDLATMTPFALLFAAFAVYGRRPHTS